MDDHSASFFKKRNINSHMLRIYLCIGFVTTIMVGSMGYAFYIGNNMVSRHGHMVEAAMKIKIEVSMGHLWFEEMISGDISESMGNVLTYFDNADWYAKAMLEGGENAEGKYIALKRENLRRQVEELRHQLGSLREMTIERWKSKELSGVGSEIDKKYDALFWDFINNTHVLRTNIAHLIERELKIFRIIKILSILICLMVAVIVGKSFSSFIHRQISDNLSLDASNQQLKAFNQQLIATEQQLKAANQRLNASNQQLRTQEQEILKSRQLYRTIFEGSISALVVYDVIGEGADFIFKEFNSAAEKIDGIPRKDVIGKSVLEVFPGVKEFGLLDVFKRVYKTGRSEHFPVSIYKDERITGWRDNYVFKLESGEIVASYEDVTKQKKAEESLKFQAMLLDQIQDHVVATDLEGRITYVNSAVTKRRGLHREDFIGKKTDVLGENPKLGATQKEILEKTISDGQWYGEVVNRTADGEEFILDCKTYSVYDSDGKRKGLSSVSRDITQLKQHEKQLMEYQKQLQDLVSQLAIIEEKERKRIASKLHDNICQGMVFLKMNVDFAISKGLHDKHDKILKGMSKTIAGILDDLQNVTNDLGSHLLYELGLKSALQEWISREIENKHKIVVSFTSDEDYCNLDTDMKTFLFRSIKELLINIVKHAKAGSVEVSLKRDEKVITVRVFDDGVGLKGSKGKADGDYKKGGYGLFSIKEQLNHFGGDMKFIKENAPGTRVEIMVPIDRDGE